VKFKRAVLFFIPIIVLFFWFGFHPVLWMSNDSIQSYLLRRNPVGTDISAVRSFLADKSGAGDESIDGPKTIIRKNLGSFRVLFWTDVMTSWEFDKNTKLTSIRVWKETDAL
jgi:hypothetical protein